MRTVEAQLRQLIRGILSEAAGPGKITDLVTKLEQINAQLAESELFRDRDPAEMPKFGIGLSIEGELAHVGFAAWDVEVPGDFYWSTSQKAEETKELMGGIEVPHGKIRFGRVQRNPEPCLGTWSIWNTFDTTSGWGPLLYDLAIEVATERAGGLTSDRESVSVDARSVWTTYDSSRPDVTQAQLDISDADIEKWKIFGRDAQASVDQTNANIKKWKTLDLAHLTPDVVEDDCMQMSSLLSTLKSGDAWHESPLSRAYRKPPTTLAALRNLGLLTTRAI